MVKPLPSMVQAVTEEEVQLSCEASGIPRPTVTWQKEGLNTLAGEMGVKAGQVLPVCPCPPRGTVHPRRVPTTARRLHSSPGREGGWAAG